MPDFDPTLGVPVATVGTGSPRNRIVAIGDSLLHGFQSGAVFNTDLSVPAIIAYELGWPEQYRYPRYPGPGGLPLNPVPRSDTPTGTRARTPRSTSSG